MVMTSRLSASTPSACHRRGYGCIEGLLRGIRESRDDEFSHASDRRALGDEERELPQRVLLARGLDRPPDRVATGEARGQRRAVAERAFVTLEGRERDAALVRLVAVMDQEARQAMSIPASPDPDIGATPLFATLVCVRSRQL